MPFKWSTRRQPSSESQLKTNVKAKQPNRLISLLRRQKEKWGKRKRATHGSAAAAPLPHDPGDTVEARDDRPVPVPAVEEAASAPEGKPDESPAPPEDEPETVQRVDEASVQKLFSGAPQFTIGNYNGAPRPAMSFPWDRSLHVRDVSDCRPLEHPAFAAATLRRHNIEPETRGEGDAAFVGYEIGVQEVPSMLSARGNEPGTVGWEYFLEDPVGDAVGHGREENEEEGFGDLRSWELLQVSPEKIGIRPFELEAVAERLAEMSDAYQALREASVKIDMLKSQTPVELYTVLFGKLLTPPKFDSSTEDPTGLKVQIEALTKTLKIKGVWFDFSQVEWRIRAGQLLWSEESQDGLSPDEEQDDRGLPERSIFLLQLLLACELLFRLDAIASLSAQEVTQRLHLTSEEIANFRDLETRKTRWDLVLARRFLDSVQAKTITRSTVVQHSLPQRGFFMLGSQPEPTTTTRETTDVVFLPRKAAQQISGLLHFARTLDWPEIDVFETHLSSSLSAQAEEDALLIPSPSTYATPLSTPRSSGATPRNSGYFERPTSFRNNTQRSFQLNPPVPISSRNSDESVKTPPTALIGGWLTRSLISGLILPGEPLSHFLISALLENDPAALATLGDSATLYGGFAYRARSYWSKACIVARVLAPLRGAAESMGWVSVPLVPRGLLGGAGWIEIATRPPPTHTEAPEPLIKRKDDLVRDMDFLAGDRAGNVPAEDLVLPMDPERLPSRGIWFEGLKIEPDVPTVVVHSADESEGAGVGVGEDDLMPERATVYAAECRFSSASMSRELGHPGVPLAHLVQFVSAMPCTPPGLETLGVLRRGDEGEGVGVEKVSRVPGHPLHVKRGFEVVTAVELLGKGFEAPGGKVLVVDARGDRVLEVLARAWCSWRRKDALATPEDTGDFDPGPPHASGGQPDSTRLRLVLQSVNMMQALDLSTDQALNLITFEMSRYLGLHRGAALNLPRPENSQPGEAALSEDILGVGMEVRLGCIVEKRMRAGGGGEYPR
ncbi:hypothetical protein EJ06DRAFT_553109 [Trichodelitschia bisporula]|uniref:Uncharacterized protein n=1 Tax=Trichodelitschia bisporula TaxID=703511 RepID=A0A6G1I799_9PEZI|nr:hypothetical protein EJ06DRAFT_553109 [Trichodelitschia bisporula]